MSPAAAPGARARPAMQTETPAPAGVFLWPRPEPAASRLDNWNSFHVYPWNLITLAD